MTQAPYPQSAFMDALRREAVRLVADLGSALEVAIGEFADAEWAVDPPGSKASRRTEAADPFGLAEPPRR